MWRKKIGGFYLVEQISTGGMSHVYLALNPRTREKRAVKILAKRATESPSIYTRFVREVEIIRGLSHPNIVKILDSGSTEDFCYYAMEYMPGGNLSRRIERGRLPMKEAIDLFGLICDAMAYAHSKGVIHSDLKPGNILLNAANQPMVSDFGITKILNAGNPRLTSSSEIIGTIAYLAPEQRFSAKDMDKRADVFALGTILYEMLMGFPPLGKFPWPRETQHEFPESIQCIMEKCLAIDPRDRYENAGTLILELDKYQASIGEKTAYTHKESPISDEDVPDMALPNNDRIERWFHVLRSGTTRERLGTIREMVETMESREAKAILKLYSGEGDRVRWGLIRVLGELRIAGATPMLIAELRNPFHRECAIEALGKIGAEEAFVHIREYVMENPQGALMALLPLARTGKQRAIQYLRVYLQHEQPVMRQAAVRALASIATEECLKTLKDHMTIEKDDRVRSAISQSTYYLETILFPPVEKSERSTEILPTVTTATTPV